MRRGAVWSAVLAALLVAGWPAQPRAEDRASFRLRVGGESCPYRVFSAFVLPSHELAIEIVDAPRGSSFDVLAERGAVRTHAPRRWAWMAPAEPGLYPLSVRERASEEQILLNVFVLVPASRVEEEWLNGYRIGAYPARALRGLEIYKVPRGFVEVTPENASTRLSPHFTLGQFVCKQVADYPKYVVLRPRLLLKLEHLLRLVNEQGHEYESLVIMSGYRTPFYNAALRDVAHSRHIYGGAADIYADEHPRDGVMDDLNRDGAVDRRDAEWLYDLIDAHAGREPHQPLLGGLGAYGATDAHGPFVHVDVRGFKARWGR